MLTLLGLQGAMEMKNVHPLFVHFPIALLLMSSLFYWSGTIFKNTGLMQAGRWSLYGGTVFGVISVITGLQAAYSAPHDDTTHRIMLLHQNLAYGILAASATLSVWTLVVKLAIPVKGKRLFLATHLVLAAVVIQQADLGGRMVFLKGVGVGDKSSAHETGGHDHSAHAH